mmetsp:Transcript_99008/g.288732  ORF Transcript_99008/g.288732 Transcript_99008/m.288732 type:complete len:233 (-) Transcript_99008:17-715(-)
MCPAGATMAAAMGTRAWCSLQRPSMLSLATCVGTSPAALPVWTAAVQTGPPARRPRSSRPCTAAFSWASGLPCSTSSPRSPSPCGARALAAVPACCSTHSPGAATCGRGSVRWCRLRRRGCSAHWAPHPLSTSVVPGTSSIGPARGARWPGSSAPSHSSAALRGWRCPAAAGAGRRRNCRCWRGPRPRQERARISAAQSLVWRLGTALKSACWICGKDHLLGGLPAQGLITL